MKQIQFVDLRLGETVYCMGGGLGFTKSLYLYFWAEDATEVEHLAKAYCKGKGIVFDKVGSVSPAKNQRVGSYAFPESIYGLPYEVAAEAITARNYGEKMTNETLATLRQNCLMIKQGLDALEATSAAAELSAQVGG